MLGFPVSTEFNKRIPKQKFYDNLDVSPTLRRVFVDQIRLVYWRNKLWYLFFCCCNTNRWELNTLQGILRVYLGILLRQLS